MAFQLHFSENSEVRDKYAVRLFRVRLNPYVIFYTCGRKMVVWAKTEPQSEISFVFQWDKSGIHVSKKRKNEPKTSVILPLTWIRVKWHLGARNFYEGSQGGNNFLNSLWDDFIRKEDVSEPFCIESIMLENSSSDLWFFSRKLWLISSPAFIFNF